MEKTKISPLRKTLRFHTDRKRIEALISMCSKKTAAILQTIKETGMRIGDALRLKWNG